jgi:hypothetical protein
LINAFASISKNTVLLDPACGGGTFLVRAYDRIKYLDKDAEHSELLNKIFGCDILSYSCHLSTTNLAIRDLIDDDNFPIIHRGDFLKLAPGDKFAIHPVRMQAGGLPVKIKEILIHNNHFDSIVGNPPYIDARDLGADLRDKYHNCILKEWPQYNWSKESNIYLYFWNQAYKFLKQNGVIALLTQSGWLDTEYGFPLQLWMLERFRIIAILESDIEPWFTDARVSTAITVVKSENDENERNNNLVRFVTLKKRIADVIEYSNISNIHKRCNFFVEQILNQSNDITTKDYRLRIVKQGELKFEGSVSKDVYRGSKWGRYLRASDSLHKLQNKHKNSFVELGTFGDLKRGITTNCDPFFIVEDQSFNIIETINENEIKSKFNIEKRELISRQFKIIKRADGALFALENRYLTPILKTGRGLNRFATSNFENNHYCVVLPVDKDCLSKHAKLYVKAAEREGWHQRASFRHAIDADRDWYVLREREVCDIIIPKAVQYSPLVILNDDKMIVNQRLYQLKLLDGYNSKAIAAILNSTISCSERYAAVKSFGREAYIELEVFSTQWMRVLNPTIINKRNEGRLEKIMESLIKREMGSLVESSLLNCSLKEAQLYDFNHPVGRELWPNELVQEDRNELDRIVLEMMGYSSEKIENYIELFYNDLVAYTRRLRILELEAQENRRGQKGVVTSSARDLADELWLFIEKYKNFKPRTITKDFLEDNESIMHFHVPTGKKAKIAERELFDNGNDWKCDFGGNRIELPTREHCELVVTLSKYGFYGEQALPISKESAKKINIQISNYLNELKLHFDKSTMDITTNENLRKKIIIEAFRRLR